MVGDGLTAKLALINFAKNNFKILWVKKNTNHFVDKRTTLLTPSSIKLLNENEIWEKIKNKSTPTKSIKIASFEQNNFTELKNEDNSPLAWLIENYVLENKIQLHSLLGKGNRML